MLRVRQRVHILSLLIAFTGPLCTGARADEVFVYQRIHFDQTRNPRDVLADITEPIRNPITGPLIVAAAIYFGVPPNYIKTAAGIAASQATKIIGEEADTQWHVPTGYSYCAVRPVILSVVPAGGDRASLYEFAAEPTAVGLHTWTPALGVGQGRSWVEGEIEILWVKIDQKEMYSSVGKCAPLGARVRILSCRGTTCPALDGHPFIVGSPYDFVSEPR
jgi:hypothetical protein